MDFLTAVKTCFRKYFDFKTRAPRSEFWFLVLFIFAGILFLKLLDNLIFGTPLIGRGLRPLSDSFAWLTWIPLMSVGVRRLHDTGRSGWWMGSGYLWLGFSLIFAIIFSIFVLGAIDAGVITEATKESYEWVYTVCEVVPIVMIGVQIAWAAALFVFFCFDTTAGDNRFGKDMKYGRGSVVFD